MLSWQQLLEKVKKEIKEVTTEELHRELQHNPPIAIVDVREHDEFVKGHLPNAIFLPRGFLELRIESTIPDREEKIYLYCGGGNRSALAARSLQEMGYKSVASLKGGFSQWSKEGKPVEFPREQDLET
jgi:sulfur-carrier protein adenylyltransferase/sulfurtransferase